MNLPDFKLLEKLTLGNDSRLELVEINGQKFILKTYLGDDALTKRNGEINYCQELNKIGLKSLKFKYLEHVNPDQLCIEYIENLKTLDTLQDPAKFSELAIFMQKLWKLSNVQTAKFVDNDKLIETDISSYFDWLINDIPKRNADQKYTHLANQFIDEFRNSCDGLCLLHSDFHENNIGFVGDQVLLFDSGHCPHLFGHPYTDITRLFMYYPEQVIFDKETAQQRIKPFTNSLEFDYNSTDFQKFCFIQSLLIYNNPHNPRIKEICEYLYQKLLNN